MDPASIVADRSAGTLSIEWEDGTSCRLDARRLRYACPCAVCAGEWGRPGKLAGEPELAANEFELTDVLTVGSYALMPVWASGHADGIYTFEYLYSLGG